MCQDRPSERRASRRAEAVDLVKDVRSGAAAPNARAAAIINGLIRTGRASHPKLFHGFVQLARATGEFYYVAFRGNLVLRGGSLKDADELQPGFSDAMERAGSFEQAAASVLE